MSTTKEKKLTLVPLGAHVALRRVNQEEVSKTNSMIVKPETYEEKSVFADVVHRGETITSSLLVEGARVMIGRYAGFEIKINGEELVVCKEEEVIAVIQEG